MSGLAGLVRARRRFQTSPREICRATVTEMPSYDKVMMATLGGTCRREGPGSRSRPLRQAASATGCCRRVWPQILELEICWIALAMHLLGKSGVVINPAVHEGDADIVRPDGTVYQRWRMRRRL